MISFENPFRGSTAVELFAESGRAAFIDIDGTITYSGADYSGKIAVDFLRSMLREKKVPLFMVTARTPDLVMSSGAYRRSKRLGFERQAPLRGPVRQDSSRTYVPLESLEEFEALLDPDGGILGFGTGPHIWHDGGYMPDAGYERKLGRFWRAKTLRALEDAREKETDESLIASLEAYEIDILKFLSPIEDELAYAKGMVDVQPLAYRIQFDFNAESDDDDARSKAFSNFVRAKEIVMRQLKLHELLPVRIVDESRPDDGRYTFYVMPVGSSKEEMVTYAMNRLCEESGRPIEQASKMYAGDTTTDLPCCDAAPGAKGVFVLIGRRLGSYFRLGCDRRFGDQDLSGYRKRLSPNGTSGRYRLAMECGPDRDFIVCDEAHPHMRAPQSVAYEVGRWLVAPIN